MYLECAPSLLDVGSVGCKATSELSVLEFFYWTVVSRNKTNSPSLLMRLVLSIRHKSGTFSLDYVLVRMKWYGSVNSSG